MLNIQGCTFSATVRGIVEIQEIAGEIMISSEFGALIVPADQYLLCETKESR